MTATMQAGRRQWVEEHVPQHKYGQTRDIADLAVEDLRQWQAWDLTPQVLGEFGKPTHAAPIVRRTIVRYALCCPKPEATRFVADLRQRDPELVREIEDSLQFEKK